MSEHFDVAVLGMGPGGEVAASRLIKAREAVDADMEMPQIIKTVRNGGYVLAGQVTVEPPA